MPKQQIEINVPEGMEVNDIEIINDLGSTMDIRVHLKKGESKSIEIRDYLCRLVDGRIVAATVTKEFGTVEQVESNPYFLKWIDHDWRKVEV